MTGTCACVRVHIHPRMLARSGIRFAWKIWRREHCGAERESCHEAREHALHGKNGRREPHPVWDFKTLNPNGAGCLHRTRLLYCLSVVSTALVQTGSVVSAMVCVVFGGTFFCSGTSLSWPPSKGNPLRPGQIAH